MMATHNASENLIRQHSILELVIHLKNLGSIKQQQFTALVFTKRCYISGL